MYSMALFDRSVKFFLDALPFSGFTLYPKRTTTHKYKKYYYYIALLIYVDFWK